MNALFLASSLSDTPRDIAETFGWEPRLFFSQVLSFIIVAFVLVKFAYKPILAVLEKRRQQIAEANLNAEKIKQQLAEAEQRYSEILAKGNAEAQKMIEEARTSASQ
jgi:F-type H+-transporting ATPase subunit b